MFVASEAWAKVTKDEASNFDSFTFKGFGSFVNDDGWS